MGAFSLGRVVATPGALEMLEEQGENPLFYLYRHHSGDWGELDNYDHKENELALKHGWRIVSSYAVVGSYVWVIMEAGPPSYEADELPDCSTPRHVRERSREDPESILDGGIAVGGQCVLQDLQSAIIV